MGDEISVECYNKILDILNNGSRFRLEDGMDDSLVYGVPQLMKFFSENDFSIESVDKFIDNCNKIISESNNYNFINSLFVENNYIICVR